ncbi:MAG: bile acid:sodium symporter [Cellvibrionaceae bacterium]|nr:bile acid:sodium symporter [Cellvibrionaceae bacterium]
MADFYIANEYWFAVFQLVMAMLGMGATLAPRDFKELMLEPKAVSYGTLIQLVLVPLVAYLTILVFGLAGGVAVGIAIIASVPGGSTSNIFTLFARGNIALSISITAITTMACLFTTPLILDLLVSAYMPAGFVLPKATIVLDIALTLLLPLAIGMLYRRLFLTTAQVFSQWCIRASIVGLVLIVLGASISGRLDLEAFAWGNVLLVILFGFLLLLLSWLVLRVLSLPTADATAVEMEVVVRNINLGLMLKAILFPAAVGQTDMVGDMALFVLLIYGGLQLAMAAALIAYRRRLAGP